MCASPMAARASGRPRAGAWIETQKPTMRHLRRRSPPRGAWIETPISYARAPLVSPAFAG